jgi:hypothetical protein
MSSYRLKHGMQFQKIHPNVALAAGTGKLGLVL